MKHEIRTLEQDRIEFSNRKLITMPFAGTIAWFSIGIAGILLPVHQAVWALFIGTGSIVYLGMLLSKFTGEDFMNKQKPGNSFDNLFMIFVAMALLVYAIAIPFFMVDYSSLPMTVGILTGLMWMPLSWILRHWVGIFHSVTRTISIVALWYLFPEQRFIVIPFCIVIIYLITIAILQNRWRNRKI